MKDEKKKGNKLRVLLVLLAILLIGAMVVGGGVANKETGDAMSDVLQEAQSGY